MRAFSKIATLIAILVTILVTTAGFKKEAQKLAEVFAQEETRLYLDEWRRQSYLVRKPHEQKLFIDSFLQHFHLHKPDMISFEHIKSSSDQCKANPDDLCVRFRDWHLKGLADGSFQIAKGSQQTAVLWQAADRSSSFDRFGSTTEWIMVKKSNNHDGIIASLIREYGRNYQYERGKQRLMVFSLSGKSPCHLATIEASSHPEYYQLARGIAIQYHGSCGEPIYINGF